MNTNFYKSYVNNIASTLNEAERKRNILKGFESNFIGESDQYPIIKKATTEELFNSLSGLSAISGYDAKYHESPGLHPDYSHLKGTDNKVCGNITSMFIDIKNSTGLFLRYDPETVENITKTIQLAALHTCWYFDGYIQRFHGDGLLAYFGRKSGSQTPSLDAINAASLFTYFVKYDLPGLFEESGIEKIYTRIGIDRGVKDEDVLWHSAGTGSCSEVTTCSLHTSLAAKMQNHANSNGIMVGDNVKNTSRIEDNLFSIKEGYRYIFRNPDEGFNYTQWVFNWVDHIKSFTSSEGRQAVFASNTKNIQYLKEQTSNYKPYFNGRT